MIYKTQTVPVCFAPTHHVPSISLGNSTLEVRAVAAPVARNSAAIPVRSIFFMVPLLYSRPSRRRNQQNVTQVALSIFSRLPGFSLAMILAPIIGALRIFKKPSGVLFTTAQLSSVACAAPVARNSAAIPVSKRVWIFILIPNPNGDDRERRAADRYAWVAPVRGP